MELVVTLAVFGIISAIALSNIKVLESPIVTTSANLSHFFRLVRVSAIAQTRSIKVVPTTTHHLATSTATSCADENFTDLPELSFDLEDEVSLDDTNWVACFTQRGQADEYVSFTISTSSASRTVEIALGGGVQIQ